MWSSDGRNSRRSSFISIGSGKVVEDAEWYVGGRYKVRSRRLPLREEPDLESTQSGEIKHSEEVLLLQAQNEEDGTLLGLVVPPPPKRPGWIILERPSEPCHLWRRRLPTSWELSARYSVRHPATLRASPNLSSDWVGEVTTGDEVLVVELGLCHNDVFENARLRMLVRTNEGLVGWLSPETATGDNLLEPLNLLGPRVVDAHLQSLSAGRARSSIFTSGQADVRGVLSRQGRSAPWQVSGQYRVLEAVALRETHELSSAQLAKVPAGTLVTIKEMKNTDCAALGRPCPCAHVTVDDGSNPPRTGWVRCAAKDGHDLVDTRNQKEREAVVQKISLYNASGFVMGRPAEGATPADTARSAEGQPTCTIVGTPLRSDPGRIFTAAAGTVLPCMDAQKLDFPPSLKGIAPATPMTSDASPTHESSSGSSTHLASTPSLFSSDPGASDNDSRSGSPGGAHETSDHAPAGGQLNGSSEHSVQSAYPLKMSL